MLNEIFKGNNKAYGKYIVGKKDAKGKTQGRANTIKKPPTEALFKLHIEGKQGLGIIPIMDGNVCLFGAIDIDEIGIDLKKLERKIKKIGLPLIVCRSKSGGAHLYLFLKEPTSAELVQGKLSQFSAKLGYAGVEIFPKQIKLDEKIGTVGNWINLPYFNAEDTTRYAIRNGNPISMDEFIVYAQHKAITSIKLEGIKFDDETFKDGPPCLNTIAEQGAQEGTRNTVIFNIGTYCRKAFPDEWQDKLDEYNLSAMSNPLKSREMTQTMRALNKKIYAYQCNEPALKQVCNKALCIRKKFGVGDSGSNNREVTMGMLSQITTDPPRWFLDVDGETLELTTDELINQVKFRKVCAERIHKFPSKQKNWDETVDKLLTDVEVLEAPEDAGNKGQFLNHFKDFLSKRHHADSKNDLLTGLPYEEEGRIFFRSNDLINHLSNKNFRSYSTAQIYTKIRDIPGAGHHKENIKGTFTNFWSIPVTNELKMKLEIDDEEF